MFFGLRTFHPKMYDTSGRLVHILTVQRKYLTAEANLSEVENGASPARNIGQLVLLAEEQEKTDWTPNSWIPSTILNLDTFHAQYRAICLTGTEVKQNIFPKSPFFQSKKQCCDMNGWRRYIHIKALG